MQALASLAQQLVAHLVAVALVDHAKVVQIDADDTQPLCLAARNLARLPGDLARLLEPQVELPVVQGARQHVVLGQEVGFFACRAGLAGTQPGEGQGGQQADQDRSAGHHGRALE